jgi:hypothetical protein
MLTACTPTQQTTAAQIAQDASIIAAGLSGLASGLSTSQGFTAAQIAAIQSVAATVSADAAAIAKTVATPAASTVQTLANDVQVFAAMILPLTPAAPFLPIVNAALAMLPGLLAQVGITGMDRSVMSADAARLILRAAAAK